MSEPKGLSFVLELPSIVQKQIVQWRTSHFPKDAGRSVTVDNFRLTLAFPGEVSAEKQRALAVLAGRLCQPGFILILDDAGQWLRPQVVWFGICQSPRGLLQLVSISHVQATYNDCYQSLQPFHPRTILWHDTRQVVSIPVPGLRWSFSVNESVLCEFSFGRRCTCYTVLERHPFHKKS